MAFMQQNLHHKLSIDHLARMTNMSRSAFHRAFRDVTGDSPLQYLKQLRLNKAKNLITYDQQPAGLAAQQVERVRDVAAEMLLGVAQRTQVDFAAIPKAQSLDALKVIGGYVPGTLVHAARANEMSHIFFGQIEYIP